MSRGTASLASLGSRLLPTAVKLFEQPWGAGPPTWASDRGEGASECYADFGSGPAVVLGNRGVALVLAGVWVRLSAVISSCVSQTSSVVAGLL